MTYEKTAGIAAQCNATGEPVCDPVIETRILSVVKSEGLIGPDPLGLSPRGQRRISREQDKAWLSVCRITCLKSAMS